VRFHCGPGSECELRVQAATPRSVTHVLLVDPDAERRVAFAALLRRAGCRVAEATTPLEAIAHLGGSAIQSWVVVITSTVPASAMNDLRCFLGESDASIDVRVIGNQSPASALAWFVTRPV
jgi:CheY-like chemotaxis protein